MVVKTLFDIFFMKATPIGVLYQVEAAKVERDRIRLALEDMPSRSDLDAISDLHERRLRVLEAEQRQFTMDSCSCIKVIKLISSP